MDSKEKVKQLTLDVILNYMVMPRKNGSEATKQIMGKYAHRTSILIQ
jgi:DNA-binding NarL/FixJ family response regulator